MKRFIAGRWPMLLGLLVAIIVWFWPAGLVWRVETTEKLLGFSLDGRNVLMLLVTDDGKEPSRFQQRAVASGQLTGSTGLQLDPVALDWDVRLSPDRKMLLVSNRDSGRLGWPIDYYFVDAATGKPRVGPLIELRHINPGSFSKDSRWLWVYHKTNNPRALDEIDILSTTSGDVVLGLRPEQDLYPWSCRFSEDGNRVAVLWRPIKGPKGV